MLSLYLFQLLNGLGLGMIYFLIAVGLTIIFGLLNFVNFAHGAFFLLGAYLCYTVVALTGNFWMALLLAPLAVAALAWMVERLLIKRIYHLPHTFQILVTLGIALIIQEASVLIWGPVGKNIAVPHELRGVLIIGDFIYPYYRLFLIGFSALIGLGLWLLLERTRFGALVRAGSESTETVSLLGTNIFRLFSLTFALGVGLAGVAGVLFAPLRGAQPFVGPEILGIAFVVVVIGGMGSFGGALVGGLLVGVVQSMMTSLWPQGASLMIYGAMAAVILVRPYGLFGRA
ncbi:branched-chain amino acid ABC transporter permease [Pseudomonas sp. JQ170]|uniref:branched-chain amino acid ABC transporter permease n=1 Tax=Pseudomonas TaxID=286 RepID=UPI00040FA98C|nr:MULTISPECIES: branched-chain amino acid ABC transporter permease [Pseudomonas]MCW2269704.1 branched-chain amino acid transport system permease protein [Pseudomonas sp. JUb96]MDN7143774.1 branched-chain amino acid ABC transporter permease [Pseudomonas sp. JQ170]PRA58689.1 branched-chain amino acid ABC transporter permease [Pseudomonas sp. MYb187]WRO75399.1 branched-chain amino acid ABC transporter permease [Pseudomonas sp. 170C]